MFSWSAGRSRIAYVRAAILFLAFSLPSAAAKGKHIGFSVSKSTGMLAAMLIAEGALHPISNGVAPVLNHYRVRMALAYLAFVTSTI